jgi:predicted esterase
MNYKKRLSFLTLFLSISTLSTHAKSENKDSLIINYFKNEISNTEKLLIKKFDNEHIINPKETKVSSERIWKLWEIANASFEGFPKTTITSPKTLDEFPIHKWNLIKEDPLPFYYFTKGNQPDKGYPLFIHLHGSGPKKEEFKSSLSLSLSYNDGPSAYFIPQIPNERRYRWWFKAEQYAWEKLLRLSMINKKIDHNKIYFLGISEGGYGSQRLGAFYADYLAGAGPMAGGEPLRNAPPRNFRHLAFSLQTGEFDNGYGRNTLTQRALEIFDSLENKHPGYFKHQIELQKGMGHGVDFSKTTPWLVNFYRTPQPKNYEWILFPMDGRYRHCFYNIAINKSLEIKEGDEFDRAYFDFKTDQKSNSVYIIGHLTTPVEDKITKFKAGEITVYLGDQLIDLSKKVNVYYNNKKVHSKKLKLSEQSLIESCATFGDPERLFPAKVTITL